MNFRQCVIECIAEGAVVRSFNRLSDQPIPQELLSALSPAANRDLIELAEGEQEQLACFILFVHYHVWRKMQFAQARFTRSREGQSASSGSYPLPPTD